MENKMKDITVNESLYGDETLVLSGYIENPSKTLLKEVGVSDKHIDQYNIDLLQIDYLPESDIMAFAIYEGQEGSELIDWQQMTVNEEWKNEMMQAFNKGDVENFFSEEFIEAGSNEKTDRVWIGTVYGISDYLRKVTNPNVKDGWVEFTSESPSVVTWRVFDRSNGTMSEGRLPVGSKLYKKIKDRRN